MNGCAPEEHKRMVYCGGFQPLTGGAVRLGAQATYQCDRCLGPACRFTLTIEDPTPYYDDRYPIGSAVVKMMLSKKYLAQSDWDLLDLDESRQMVSDVQNCVMGVPIGKFPFSLN